MNYDLIIDPCPCCGRTLGTFHILKTTSFKVKNEFKQIVLMQGVDSRYYDNGGLLSDIFGYDYEDTFIKNKSDLIKNLERIIKKYPNSYIEREDGNKFDVNYIKKLFKRSDKTATTNYYLECYKEEKYNTLLVNNYLVLNNSFS